MRATKHGKQEDLEQLRLIVQLSQREQALLNDFQVADADRSASSVSLTFAAMERGQIAFYSTELTQNAADTLRDSVNTFLRAVRNDVYANNLDIKDYQASASLEGHQIEYMNVAQYQDVASSLEPLKRPKQIPPLHDDLNKLDLAYFVVSMKKPDGTWMHFARSISRGSQPQRTRVGFVFNAGPEYINILGEPVVFLDPSTVDWMWVGDDLYIFDKSQFEEVFEPEDPDDATDSVVREIAKYLPIANLDAFLASCRRDERMARKIRRLHGSPHLEKLSISRVKAAKNELGLGIEFGIGPDGKEGLQFIPRFKWQYVKILAEEYGNSSVTGLPYEYDGHRPISTPKKKLSTVKARRGVVVPDVAIANS